MTRGSALKVSTGRLLVWKNAPSDTVRQGNRPGSVRDPEAGVHDLDDVRGPHRNPRVRKVEARGRSRGERQPREPRVCGRRIRCDRCLDRGRGPTTWWPGVGEPGPDGIGSGPRGTGYSVGAALDPRAARSRTFTVGRRPTSGDGVSPPAEADRRVTVPSGSPRTVRRRATAIRSAIRSAIRAQSKRVRERPRWAK